MQADIHSGRGLQESSESDFICAAVLSSSGGATTSPLMAVVDGPRCADFICAKFGGATTAINGLVVFAPLVADCVGIFDPTRDAFSCVNIPFNTSDAPNIRKGKFMSATTANNGLVVFAPYFADCVGTFDPAAIAFACINVSSTIIGDSKFNGATTASDGRVVFAPSSADCVGIFDPATNVFSCIDISSTDGIFSRGGKRFNGATTASDGRVVFAPYYVDCVGIFDPTTDLFSCIDIRSTISSDGKFCGASTTSNGLVIFAPSGANCVGIFDPTTDLFRCVDISTSISSNINFDYGKFRGATTASDGRVIFAPYGADCVGIFEPTTNVISCDPLPSDYWYNSKFLGATTASDGRIVFAPYNADCVGTVTLRAKPTPPPSPPAPPTPPPPPPPPPPSTGTVVLTLTAGGSVSDYTDDDKSSLQQKVASAAGVYRSLVTISVAAASVRITATIAVPAYTTADVLQALLSSSFGTADAASTALGVTVEEEPAITFEEAPTMPTASDSSSALTVPLIVGIAAGALVFGVLLGVCAEASGACVMVHRRQQQNKPGMLKQAGVPDPEASTAQLNNGSL